jgi:hypothetical protein
VWRVSVKFGSADAADDLLLVNFLSGLAIADHLFFVFFSSFGMSLFATNPLNVADEGPD